MAACRLIHQPGNQRGAAAIEFALVFPLFLLVLLTVVVWSTFFFVQSSIDYAAREAVRASLEVDIEAFENLEGYRNAVNARVSNAVGRSLEVLPESWREGVSSTVTIETPDGSDIDYVVVGLRYPQGTPVSGLTDLGLFQGIGLIPEDGAYAEARMPLRVTD
ncbi:TadE/TadG family type IV pilus assembly protein [uncultured Halovibrio sp.]|uniref:TadE/TadG family type IV pilus assembly protein n=1 Tax=uncultured Halovibrio sp. TaxID=985049 RepID=UPI0025F3B6EE|nr:TadE/TadG family type IV pilus assembly protein [uncultured Halovibrio sp.]